MSHITQATYAAFYNMNGKQFKQESESLDLYLQRGFCTLEKGEINAYICNSECTHLSYLALLDAHYNWVIDEILTPVASKDRARALRLAIKLAQYLLRQGNYAASLATMRALEAESIARLWQSWEQVPHQYTAWFQNQRKFLSQHDYIYFPPKEICIPDLQSLKKQALKVKDGVRDQMVQALYALQSRLKFTLQFQAPSCQVSFVPRVKVWQSHAPSFRSNFLNRSLLLE